MSLEYDRASRQRVVLGTAAAVAMDGTAFTPWIDTDAYGGKSLTMIAVISAVAAYSAVSWVWQESEDNGTTSNMIDAEKIITPAQTPTSTTSRVFHSGTVSKKRYVRAAFNAGGAQTGQITPILDHLMSDPVFTTGV